MIIFFFYDRDNDLNNNSLIKIKKSKYVFSIKQISIKSLCYP